MKAKQGTGSILVMVFGLILLLLMVGACQKTAAVKQAKVARITVGKVKERMDGGVSFTFVDSRSQASWETALAKIPGAFRVPPDEID